MADVLAGWMTTMAPHMPRRELVAFGTALTCMSSYQLAWILDYSGAAVLVKARRIGGSFAYAFAAALWACTGEDVSYVSVGERESLRSIADVERHCVWLASLGSHWARPARARYRTDLTIHLASGGTITALPSTGARGMGGSVILDEFAFHQDPERVWEASAAATLHGSAKLRVLSTPAGIGGLFYDLATEPNPDYRRFRTTLTEARAAGLVISDKKIRQIDRGNQSLHAMLFECSFLARGDSLFVDVHRYTEPPRTMRIAIGVDFAYSAETRSDYSVAVVVAESEGRFFVLDVLRRSTTNFEPELRVLAARFPGAFFHWYTGPSEQLYAEGLKRQGFRLLTHTVHRGEGKFTRALPCAAAWNAGAILVPTEAPWVSDFIGEVSTFHGGKMASNQHDDQVDALVSAFAALREGHGTTTSAGAPAFPPRKLDTPAWDQSNASPAAAGPVDTSLPYSPAPMVGARNSFLLRRGDGWTKW